MEGFEDPSLSQAEEAQVDGGDAGGDVHAEVVGGAAGGEPPPAQSVMQMSADGQQTSAQPSASELAFDQAPQTQQAAKKKGGHTSHDGGFDGFGAEYEPYSYTDPRIDHSKLDPKLRKLGVQHTRIFVPWNAVTTGLLGMAGPDLEKEHIDQLTQLVDQNPDNADLQKKLANAKKQYAQDTKFTQSFLKTVALAGKHTAINLTFFGAVGQPERAKEMAHILKYFIDQGYDHLQTTLENEPNGGNAKGHGYRSDIARAIKNHDHAAIAAATKKYVDAYQNLSEELTAIGARDQVKVVGGDMVGHNRETFFRSIVQQGLNKYVDAYSLHVYWGMPGHSLSHALGSLKEMQKLAAKIAPGKAMQVTEFGKKTVGTTAAPRNEETAFEEGLFALSAVNDGYTGLVKWDAFYDGPPSPEKGNPGKFYLIGGPQKHYDTDAMYSLMRLFTHSTEPGWRAHGVNHGEQSVECTFRSPDGSQGTILAMSKGGGSVNTHGLPPHGGKLHVHTWKNGALESSTVAHGASVAIPTLGAVAVSTKPFG